MGFDARGEMVAGGGEGNLGADSFATPRGLAASTTPPVGGALGSEDRVRLALPGPPGRRLRWVRCAAGPQASSTTCGRCPLP